MGTQVLEQALAVVHRLMATHPGGVSASAVSEVLDTTPHRTVQRALASLVSRGELVRTGRARATRYAPPQSTHGGQGATPAAPQIPDAAEPPTQWMSTAGAKVAAYVSAPIVSRSPVGYSREYLDAYRPNVDHYLPSPLRAHLRGLGQVVGIDGPAGTYARQVFERLLIDLSWASSHLEGNTYSRLDTENLVRFGHQAIGKDHLETQMILNHKAAIEMIVDNADTVGFDRYTIQGLHALLSEGLLPDSRGIGRLRTTLVGMGSSAYQPTAVPRRIEDCFDTILSKARNILDPFEQSFFAMVHLPYLQPFIDVNKRVSRLAANIPLVQHNVSPLSFVDLPRDDYIRATLGVYELRDIALLRDLYVWAYEHSCQRYSRVREARPKPDPLRLQHRYVVREVVYDVVAENQPVADSDLRRRAADLVDPAHLHDVAAIAFNELHHLHEGSIARFKLRPSQFAAWTHRPRTTPRS